MARSGPVWVVSATALALAVVACTYKFDDVPETAQIACADGGAPCPDNWECDESVGRCVPRGSVPEIPEIRLNPSTSLTTTEAGGGGGTASLAVRLGATPTAPVRILVVSTRTSEATVYPSEMTFGAADWNQPQVVTVLGVPDSVVDGDQPYEVVLGPPVTNDARYAALPEIRVPGTNKDSDDAGIMASTSTFRTSEADYSSPTLNPTISVHLTSRPSGLVTVPVTSLDENEGTVFPAELVFDAGNWNAPQMFRPTGVEDYSTPTVDPDHPYTVRLGPAVSTDPHYQGVKTDLTGYNADNDSPGIYVSQTSGLTVWESIPFGSFGVVLQTQPAADVTMRFNSLTPSQVNVDPATATLTFDAGNWSSYQYVNLIPVDDQYDDLVTDEPWTIQSSNSVSADPNYNGIDVDDVTGFTHDDEEPALLFGGNPYGYVTVAERGASQAVTITLAVRPFGQITIRPSSTNPGKVLVSPSTIILDQNTWSTGAPITVTPVDNDVREFDPRVDVTFLVTAALPADFGYQNLPVPPLDVTIQDDERVIFSLTTQHSGDFTDTGGTYFVLDYLCQSDQKAYDELQFSPLALLAVDAPNLGLQRIASTTSNSGLGQQSWVLTSGRNYVSETKTGPVIGRANGQNLFDFPLSHALGAAAAGNYWTGLEDDWTSAPNNCIQWSVGSGSSGREGASGAVDFTALSKGNSPCDVPHRILCVEQY